MANLKNRIGKAEEAYMALTEGEVKRVLFWRDNPDTPSEQEIEFLHNNPDFKGEKVIFHFGSDNLDPDSREV